MDPSQAERFARCLTANPAFTAVAVETSPRNQAKRFVAYVPTNPQRRAEMLTREQDKRQAKAETEGRDYVFAKDPDSVQPFCWVLSTSGEVYETTLFDCSCPDFRFRLQGTGVCCKHMTALSISEHQPFETVGAQADDYTPEEPFGPGRPLTAEEEAEYDEWLARREEEAWNE